MMRILVIHSAEIIPYMVQTLKDMGHTVTYMTGENVTKSTKKLRDNLSNYLSDGNGSKYDLVMSFDFFYIVSIVCYEYGIKYVSWVFDSPQAELFHPEVYNENNYIYIFDKAQYVRLSKKGKGNLFHLPLAGDVEGLKTLSISSGDIGCFEKEIAFVGNMYEDNLYDRCISQISETEVEHIQNYLMGNLCDWKKTRPWPKVSYGLITYFTKISPQSANEAYEMPLDEYYGSILLSRKLAQMERMTLLHRLAEREKVSVFTNSPPSLFRKFLGNVYPAVDYRTDMRKIFHLSRINLNISMPSIETGVPLRVYDIMSAGGFCLTNWQDEVEELFEIGTDIEVYHDLDELYEKVRFYLTHEEIRLKIALRGYMKIRDRYNYRYRLTEMLDNCQKVQV